MNITRSNENGVEIVAIEGKIDTLTAPQLQPELTAILEENANIKIDFKEVTYVSSAGLRVLLMGAKLAKAKGGKQTFANVPDMVMEVFEMTGLTDVFDFE